MNLKLRLKNSTTLLTLLLAAVALVYQILALFDIMPKICQDDLVTVITMIVDVLLALGILVDPTTEGIGDSDLAKSYDEPASRTTEEGDE